MASMYVYRGISTGGETILAIQLSNSYSQISSCMAPVGIVKYLGLGMQSAQQRKTQSEPALLRGVQFHTKFKCAFLSLLLLTALYRDN